MLVSTAPTLERSYSAAHLVHLMGALLWGIRLHALVADEANLHALKEEIAGRTSQFEHFTARTKHSSVIKGGKGWQ
jgi:hypothetical protein